MSGNAIEAKALSKRFPVHVARRNSLKERLARGRAPEKKYFWALRDASFDVPRGSSLGLIGPNGSGKSTALKVLAGIYTPTSGSVAVNGSVSALLEVGAGFHPELTGRENIRLNATILGFTNRQIDRLMDSIIEFADIGDHIDAPIKHYSSGMYVRLGFSVAVMVRPDILLVDEVIAVGDEEFQRRCFDYLYDLRRAGTSMIIVSHGLGQITELCDEALWLSQGDAQQLGPSRLVVAAYLASVNRAESERSAAQNTPGPLNAEALAPPAEVNDQAALSDVQLARSGSRGSLKKLVAGIEILDRQGAPTSVLFTGAPAIVRLHTDCDVELDLVEVELGLLAGNGITACAIFTQPDQPLTIPPGRGIIEFEMDSLLLTPGRYELLVTLRRQGHVLSSIEGGAAVSVRDSGIKVGGIFLQPGGWHSGTHQLAEMGLVPVPALRGSVHVDPAAP